MEAGRAPIATLRLMPAQRGVRVGPVLTVLIVFGFAVAGCSGEPSKADTAAVGQAALKGSQLKVTSAVELCIGKSMIDASGLGPARTAVGKEDLSKLSKTQRTVLTNAFDQCVPSSAFATWLAAGLPAGTSTEDLESCLTKQFKGKAGTALVGFAEQTKDPQTAKLFDKCPTHDLAVRSIQPALTNNGVPAAVSQCAFAQLGDLKMSDVVMQSKALETRVEAAVNACRTSK